jgi:hypothetical protein
MLFKVHCISSIEGDFFSGINKYISSHPKLIFASGYFFITLFCISINLSLTDFQASRNNLV